MFLIIFLTNFAAGADVNEQSVQVMQYSGWSECTATCGGGTKQRSRQCEGKSCDFLVLDGIETQPCNTHSCPGEFCCR